ncbi:MAG: tetratricopeptide repeat protein [Desulfovibrio sp.]|jgi:Tfp pilus assembly protein PilF|nr:tetratricopeptide repeat protein [Desulfovibrio sp.]
MLTTAPKELREDIARANGYLRRNEVERALESICSALRVFDTVRMTAHARGEPDVLIAEFLRSLAVHPGMAPLLDPGNTGKPRSIPFKPGQESKLCLVLEGLAKLLKEKSAAALQQENEERLARKKNLIASGLQFLQEGQIPKGSAFFKRVAEEFGDDKGICLHLARILNEAGQTRLAAEMFEKAMEAQPRESAAYAGAVNAWVALYEYEKAEAVYKAILRTFGGHPATFGKMAKFYLDLHKKSQAEDYALRALKADPQQPEALEVMAALDKK